MTIVAYMINSRETRSPPKHMLDKPKQLSQALVRCAKGEQGGLHFIFESEAARLVAIAQRIVRRKDLAEEVVQEAFVRIWAKAHQYEPNRGSAQGWIIAIVRNRALNMLRDGKRLELTHDGDIERAGKGDDIQHALQAWSQLDTASRLHHCLSSLDEVKRRSILMAYVSGYTHGEIAGRLNVPLGTAKAWVRRGLAALRDCMT